MSKIKILQEDSSYTFQSYFELPYEADDILAELNYLFKIPEDLENLAKVLVGILEEAVI